MRKIPRTMSTQHPDNAKGAFFCDSNIIDGENEIKETFYAFSHLQCSEQMWDAEGKEVDVYVIKKLIVNYQDYFRRHRLGRDVFITMRVPNPTTAKHEAKVLLETLESIPRSYDAANALYGDDIAPIFEVILPMATSHKCPSRIYDYYKDHVAGKGKICFNDGVCIKDWIGNFKPEKINVIPLIEDMPSLLNADTILENYLKDKEVDYQRIFLARSDPAMNYGALAGILLNKIALYKLGKLEKKIGIPIYPIIGMGSAPFRGNLKPETAEHCMGGYPSVQTFTIQSAFKYDYPTEDVINAIKIMNSTQRSGAVVIPEEECVELINRLSDKYREEVMFFVDLINEIAPFVPERRRRHLHIGQFGYARQVNGVSLPRAIKFCAAMYSIGIPPELLGLSALTKQDIRFIDKIYKNFSFDIKTALSYLNRKNLNLLPDEIRKPLNQAIDLIQGEAGEAEIDEHYNELTAQIIDDVYNHRTAQIENNILEAATARQFLG